MPLLRIGMGQILVEGGEPERNLERAADAIAQAADQGCDLAALPECLNYGWTHPSAHAHQGPATERLADAARKAGIWVAAGLVERDGERLYNSAFLLDSSGDVVLSHRKINELALAHDLYTLGACVRCVDTSLGRIGLLVCADLFPDAPELGRALGRMGCELILSPCAWAVPADHDNDREPYGALWRESYSALTQEFPLTVVGVSNVGGVDAGPWQGRKCIGCSLAVGPGGEILAQAPYGEPSLQVVEADTGRSQATSVSAIAASRTG